MKRSIGFPILSSENKKLADKNTILSEPIPSIDLLERACYRLAQFIEKHYTTDQAFHLVCGSGNNGADGLCLARILYFQNYKIRVSILENNNHQTVENLIQRNLLQNTPVKIHQIKISHDLILYPDEIIVDAILGSGLNKKVSGIIEELIFKINSLNTHVISIDNPTGIGSWDHEGSYILASKTLCLGTLSPALLNRTFNQDLEVLDIGLNLEASNPLGWFLTSKHSRQFIDSIVPQKNKHHHKGSKGHVLLIGGNKGMHGAIAMSAQMASKIGTGNVTVLSHPDSLYYLNGNPEIQFKSSELTGKSTDYFDFEGYQAIGIGPGLDCNAATTAFLSFLLGKRNLPPMVFDADALNILSKNKNLFGKIPEDSIFTPHPKELERILGKFENENEKWKILSDFSRKYGIHILAKDTYPILFCKDGEIYSCGTGTEKLAKGGSGDKLTGIIAGLMAQGIKTKHAAICGMFLLNDLA